MPVLSSLTFLPLLIGPNPLLDIEPPADEEAIVADEDSSDEAPIGEGPEDPPMPEPGFEPGVDPVPVEPPPSAKKREWMLVIAPGFDYIVSKRYNWTAIGGGFRFGGQAVTWGGKKGHFLVGGGPMLHYSYLTDAGDGVHLVTVNGDLLLGGGNQRWGVYWHATAGLGYLAAFDAQTNTKIGTVGARAATGVGGFGKINDRFSLGAVVDFGWAAGLWVNGLITANIHFGRRGDPL